MQSQLNLYGSGLTCVKYWWKWGSVKTGHNSRLACSARRFFHFCLLSIILFLGGVRQKRKSGKLQDPSMASSITCESFYYLYDSTKVELNSFYCFFVSSVPCSFSISLLIVHNYVSQYNNFCSNCLVAQALPKLAFSCKTKSKNKHSRFGLHTVWVVCGEYCLDTEILSLTGLTVFLIMTLVSF